MSSRFGRNKRRAAREALEQMRGKLVEQIDVSRRLSIRLSEQTVEVEKVRQVLAADSNWPARACGLSGPFRDNASIFTLAQKAKQHIQLENTKS